MRIVVAVWGGVVVAAAVVGGAAGLTTRRVDGVVARGRGATFATVPGATVAAVDEVVTASSVVGNGASVVDVELVVVTVEAARTFTPSSTEPRGRPAMATPSSTPGPTTTTANQRLLTTTPR